MRRITRVAAFLVAATLVMSGFALAHDEDDGYYRQGNPAQARQYGYQNGYRDGARRGQHEDRENDPNDYQTPDWHQATRGYKGWMGPVDWYRRGYQQGYSDGFGAALQSAARPWGDGDRDDRGTYDDRRGYDSNARDIAYRFGYEDGSAVGRRDIERRNSYNPNPRGKFDDRDHGYRREYGSKNQYKADYRDGYIAGYESVMGNRY